MGLLQKMGLSLLQKMGFLHKVLRLLLSHLCAHSEMLVVLFFLNFKQHSSNWVSVYLDNMYLLVLSSENVAAKIMNTCRTDLKEFDAQPECSIHQGGDVCIV